MSEIESALDKSPSDPDPSLVKRDLASSDPPSWSVSNAGARLIPPDAPIRILELPSRIHIALHRAHVTTLGDLTELVRTGELTRIPRIGKKSAAVIEDTLDMVHVLSREAARPAGPDGTAQKALELPPVPWEVIEWQASLVQRQLSSGLLHSRARTGKQSVSQLLSSVKGLDSHKAYEAMASLIGGSLNLCEELEFVLDRIYRDDYILVLLSRYGFEVRTLDDLGSCMGITVERVRQLRSKLKRDVGSLVQLAIEEPLGEVAGRPSFLRMQTALLTAEDIGLDITYESWRRRILYCGLVGSWTAGRYSTMDPIETMIAVCNLVADRGISELTIPANLEYALELATSGSPRTPAKIARIRKSLAPETARLVRRHTRFTGAVHAGWLAKEIDESLGRTAEILRALDYELVSGNWFAPRSRAYRLELTEDGPFGRAVAKMTQYCGPLSTDSICSGLRHWVSRTRFPVADPEVMERILSMYEYRLDDGHWQYEVETDEQLTRSETIIKQCIDECGPVVRRSQLKAAFAESDLSVSSLSYTLRRSPIFERIDRGLYKLRGNPVPLEDNRTG
ncbi:MAG: DNA-directed RNA polymerase subunit alpha C-terminal domain-containing protein [bacterium]